MSLRLYDTATREVRDFDPIEPGRVGVYLCGATVQSAPHIGHLRSGLAFDILRRWLTHRGFEVVFIRNVTDIDDKILARSAQAGCPWWVIAADNERAFTAGYDALNVLPPTYEPRATGHVTEMVEMVGVLIERGHAYPAADGSGDVYFDVRSFDGYGALTNQRLDDMAPSEDADPRGKRDPRDFALWKGHKPGEPASASWPTPWGRGRPGWHLECSAMAAKYLGTTFDIHGGGVDLRFPHHENERAQSHAAGQEFARFWMHNGWVTTGGEKMSKSLGNSLLVTTMLEQTRPVVLRYYLGAAHYRSTIEYGPDSLREAEAAYERIEGFVARASERLGDGVAAEQASPVPAPFADAMDDDLAVPAALAVVHETVRVGNRALDAEDEEALARALAEVLAMTGVLGIDPTDQHWVGASSRGGSGQATYQALEALVRAELEARAQARADKDFDAADAIRRRLSVAGIAVEDTPAGARWTLEGGA